MFLVWCFKFYWYSTRYRIQADIFWKIWKWLIYIPLSFWKSILNHFDLIFRYISRLNKFNHIFLKFSEINFWKILIHFAIPPYPTRYRSYQYDLYSYALCFECTLSTNIDVFIAPTWQVKQINRFRKALNTFIDIFIDIFIK